MFYNVYSFEPIDINFKEETNLGIDIECHQLDEVTLNFNMYNGVDIENMENYNVELRIHKPNNTDYIQSKTNITKGNGTLSLECDNRMTDISGFCQGELRIWNAAI